MFSWKYEQTEREQVEKQRGKWGTGKEEGEEKRENRILV